MPRFRRAENVLFEILDGKAVLVNPDGSELLTLNEVGTIVWEALARETAVETLTDEVLRQVTDAPRERVSGDIEGFIDELARLQLIVDCTPPDR